MLEITKYKETLHTIYEEELSKEDCGKGHKKEAAVCGGWTSFRRISAKKNEERTETE